jgi:hypothetical protein
MDFGAIVKCATWCVSLFLSIPQVTEKERKLVLLSTLKEMWDF